MTNEPQSTPDATCECGHVKNLHWQQMFDCLIEGCDCSKAALAPSAGKQAAPNPETDPCKMADAQYEEYINGPDRAPWQYSRESK